MERVPLAALAACLLASGCATPPPPPNEIYIRNDGQRTADNPAMRTQFETDRTICIGEVQKVAAGSSPIYYQGIIGAIQADQILEQRKQGYKSIMVGCMAQKGYTLVLEANAEAEAARRRAISEAASAAK